MRTARYYTKSDMSEWKDIEYDENAPCIVCGEPVIGSSMGGTVICGACDCGNCRYCGMKTMVLRPEIDEGRSKQRMLDHMKWHQDNNPDLVKEINEAHTRMMDRLDKEREERLKA